MLAAGVREYPMEYPVTTELPFDSPEYNDMLARFYDDWADRLAATWRAADDVVVLVRGRSVLLRLVHAPPRPRLQGRVEIEVVPGIPGMAGCWNAVGQPITWGDDVLTVLMGTLPEEELVRHMECVRRARRDEDRAQPAEGAPRACSARSGWMTPGLSSGARCRRADREAGRCR